MPLGTDGTGSERMGTMREVKAWTVTVDVYGRLEFTVNGMECDEATWRHARANGWIPDPMRAMRGATQNGVRYL